MTPILWVGGRVLGEAGGGFLVSRVDVDRLRDREPPRRRNTATPGGAAPVIPKVLIIDP